MEKVRMVWEKINKKLKNNWLHPRTGSFPSNRLPFRPVRHDSKVQMKTGVKRVHILSNTYTQKHEA